MAHLHEALKNLAPVAFSDVPQDEDQHSSFLESIFSKSQLLIDSVPPPPVEPLSSTRSRADTTTSIASNVSELSTSSARLSAPISEHAILQKEWGKSIRLAAKDNPMGIAVYKLGGKDGKGAWFARRSVHEGMSFSRWKASMQNEFPESMKVQGGPGSGSIRGIGGERRVESREVEGVGTMEVYQLSAQFPGPTTPRDFVTLLLTSSAACKHPHSEEARNQNLSSHPRHYMIISKPCDHPACPQREGFIRGQYESIEFIREIPLKPKRASSYGDLRKAVNEPPLDKQAMLRQAGNALSPSEGRPRGKTVSFAESRESRESRTKREAHDGQLLEEEMNPVEWIMITRSDPGGSVPRFMVERGTPGGIVSDAGKFLDWACKDTMPMAISQDQFEEDEANAVPSAIEPLEKEVVIDSDDLNGHKVDADSGISLPPIQENSSQTLEDSDQQQPPPSMLASMTSAAYNSLSPYTPQAVLDRLPSLTPIPDPRGSVEPSPPSSRHTSTTSINSFASAQSGLPETRVQPASLDGSCHSLPTQNRPASNSDPTQNNTLEAMPRPPSSSYERQIQKLDVRKTSSELKLAQTRRALLSSTSSRSRSSSLQSGQSSSQAATTSEKHVQELAYVEARHAKELASIEERRAKEAKKEADRQAKELNRKAREEEKRKANEAKEEEKKRRNEAKEVAKRKKEEFVEERMKLERENRELREKAGLLEKERTVMKGVLEEAHKENLELKIRLGLKGLEEGVNLEGGSGEGRGKGVERNGNGVGGLAK